VTERDAGVAAGLVNTSQNFGAAIGVAVASSIAASYSHTLAHHGYATAAALTGGFQRALWVCGLNGLAAIPRRLRSHPADHRWNGSMTRCTRHRYEWKVSGLGSLVPGIAGSGAWRTAGMLVTLVMLYMTNKPGGDL
jgi:hypothetical protein